MKISIEQLRKVIMKESGRLQAKQHPVESLLDDLSQKWLNDYDPNDPSMDALGEDAWYEQVEQAVGDLEDRINASIREVEARLLDGEYFVE